MTAVQPSSIVLADAPFLVDPTTSAGATAPPASVQAFRDEFGFRYDGQGNRVGARGNIISRSRPNPEQGARWLRDG